MNDDSRLPPRLNGYERDAWRGQKTLSIRDVLSALSGARIEKTKNQAQLRALLDQSKRLLASLMVFGSPQMDSNPDLEARKLNDLIVDIEKKI